MESTFYSLLQCRSFSLSQGSYAMQTVLYILNCHQLPAVHLVSNILDPNINNLTRNFLPDKEPSAAASVSESLGWCGQGSALSLYQGVVWRLGGPGPGEVVTPGSDKVQSSAASCWAAAKPSFALGPDVSSPPSQQPAANSASKLGQSSPCAGAV